MIALRNGRVELALHRLQGAPVADAEADAIPLLLLHELGSHAGLFGDEHLAWPGAVYALDFAGHGASALRHTFASRLVQAGVSLAKVSKLLGHASVTTTEIYAHLAPNEVSVEAVSVLNRLNSGND